MTRIVLWIVTGMLLGLGVHVASLFAVPYLAARNPHGGLKPLAVSQGFVAVPPRVLPFSDPALRTSLCRFDLANGPMLIHAATTDGFTSVSVYTTGGLGFYALNDHAATGNVLEFTLYTPSQLAEVRSREGPDTPESLRIAAPVDKGIVAVRSLIPTASLESTVLASLSQARCTTVKR